MKTSIPAEAIAAWDRGEKAEAIRIVREHTGLDLQESMHALESGSYSVQSVRPAGAALLPQEAAAAAARGELIQAIKLTRQATGLGLKEAKDLVERSLRTSQHPAVPPTAAPRHAGLAPGEVPRRGSAALIAILLAVAAAVLVYNYRG